MPNPCTPQLEILERPRCIPNPHAPAVEWRDKDENSPFINPRTCAYSIVVDRTAAGQQYESLGDNESGRLKAYFSYGVDRLIEFYRKDLSKGGVTRQQLVDAVLTSGKRWNVSERPTAKMKVLVALPYAEFHDLPERDYAPSYAIEDKITASFDIRTIKTKVEFVARILEKHYGKKTLMPGFRIPGIGGYGSPSSDLRNLDIQSEAKNVRNFLAYLQRFLNYNYIDIDLGSVDATKQEFVEFIMEPPLFDVTPGELNQLYERKKALEERIEEGYSTSGIFDRTSRWLDVTLDPNAPDTITESRRSDEATAAARERSDQAALAQTEERITQLLESFKRGYRILDVRYIFQDKEPKYLKIAWNTIGNVQSWNRSRVVALIHRTEELFDMFNNHVTPPWKGFVEGYIYPPLDTSGAGPPDWAKDLTAGMDDVQKTTSEVLGWIDYGADLLSGEQSLMPLIDQYVKTWAELQLENQEILNQVFQSDIVNNTERIFRLADSGVLNQARFIGGITNNLESLYDVFLDHVDVRYIIAKLITCLGLPDLDPWLLELIIALLEFLLWLADLDLATFDFNFNWAMIWRDITEALINYVLKLLMDLVNTIITEIFMMLLLELDKLCEEDYDYDSVDLSDLISNSFDSPADAARLYGSLAGNIGEGTGTGSLLRQLIKDVSAVLSAKEMCSLIRGQASTEVLTIVHNIILLDKYSPFHSKFDTLEDVSKFFSSLGGLIDPSFCELGELVPDDFSRLCESGLDRTEGIRRELLSKKEGMTSQQIEEQIADEKQRRENLLNEMIDLISTKGGVGAAITEKLNEGLQNSDIMEKISEHPSSKDAVNQMKSAVFDNTATTLVSDGFAPLETPYTIVQYEKKLPPEENIILWSEAFPANRGIMHILSDNDEHYFYKYGKTLGGPGDTLTNHSLGDGMADHLSWISLAAGKKIKAYSGGRTWTYKAKVYPKVGNFNFSGDRTTNDYGVDYSLESQAAAAARFDTPQYWEVDSPKIYTFFIERDPFVGIPIDAISKQGVPLGLATGPTLKAYGDSEFTPDKEVLRLGHDEYLKRSAVKPIDVFNDLPKVFEERLVPSFEKSRIEPKGSKQQATYMYFVTNNLQKFADKHDEDRLDVDKLPGLAAKIVNSYPCVFNDVMRILYRFATDSEFYSAGNIATPAVSKTKYMLGELKKNFNDPEKMLDLLGLTDDMEKTIQQNIAKNLTERTTSAEATNSILGEPLLRYMIRIYILEIYLKNLYMFTSRPERRNPEGLTFPNPSDLATEDILLDVKNPLHPRRTLDLKDTVDSIMVSYIAEYIDYTSLRVEGCRSFYDIASRLAKKEWEDGEREQLSVPGEGDTLAYFPHPPLTTSRAALRYYVAKELKSFIEDFQEFVELKNFLPGVSVNTPKRSLMESFLDKFEILGYNISTPSVDLDPARFGGFETGGIWHDWINSGEGLYMQFYSKHGPLKTMVWFDQLNVSLSDNDKVGLRMCLRDSRYHTGDHAIGSRGQNFGGEDSFAEKYYDIGGGDDIDRRELVWNSQLGIPILEYETTWGKIKQATALPNTNSPNKINDSDEWKGIVVDYLKQELIKTDEFRVMFEYAFPVNKLFNFMLIQMDQNASAFMVNAGVRGTTLAAQPGAEDYDQLKDLGIDRKSILGASNIDPEQFINAKGVVKSILENVNNSDNYRYINAEIEEAGGQGKLALMKQMKEIMKK